MSWWHQSNDAAASEVVGFVLVTGISVAAITIVVLTGGPALEQVRSSQQHDAMIGYFHDLDQAVSQLLSGAPAGATPVWRLSMSSGHVSVQDEGHIWAFATDKRQLGLWYGNFADGDHEFNVILNGSSGDSVQIDTIRATAWDGASETELSATSPQSTIDNGTPSKIELQHKGDDFDIAGHTVSVTFYNETPSDNPPLSRIWIVDAGAIAWERLGGDVSRIFYENSAIVSEIDSGQVLHNTPRIQAPEDTNGGEDIFVRMLRINGTASFGGRQTAEVLVSSQGSHARYSSGNVSRVQLYPPERTETTWCRFLAAAGDGDCHREENCHRGYSYTWGDPEYKIDLPGPESVAYRAVDNSTDPDSAYHTGQSACSTEDPVPDNLSVTLVETGMKVSLRGGS